MFTLHVEDYITFMSLIGYQSTRHTRVS